MTGVDRVERAYLDHLLAAPVPLFGLVRTALGYLLLDEAGCRAFAARLDAPPEAQPGLLARLARRGDPARAAAEEAHRALALDRARKGALGPMLARHLPAGSAYLNVGHSNLTAATVAGLRAVPRLSIAVMIHDTIPLDLPEMQREGTVPRFRALLDRACAEADLLIANSRATAEDIARLTGRRENVVTAPLGVAVPRPGQAPEGPWTARPYFVALGTIEPRKNHGFLLDLWARLTEELGPKAPHLLILGARGWRNAEVFARLDARPAHVHELGALPDAAVAALLAESRGLLFPSLAEGYGLPPAEAAALGVPVLCNSLPVLREVLGDKAVYADVAEGYLWHDKIMRLAQGAATRNGDRDDRPGAWRPPGWDDHFRIVLTHV
ncbi:glycosyltransferase family 4 protein [Roseivivax sp. GX 12232]|uniref:glycosyltransferase family 4 protein n=1 Tax=Roseivivax sp. GX 12232 TaxID=2900547 RepID=UPI001E3E0D62|nr:glycosyltransferase family 1 protein [Roseivivax sp. GX 12232]MCE0505475.1 glycosyltransferase family 4 protein [Roseivivax sp. GX 12232]